MLWIISASALAADITISVVDQKSNSVVDGYVELFSLSGTSKAKVSSGTIDQVDKEFTPLVSAIPVGSTIFFPNSDNIQHQIYSFSKSKEFDLPLFAKNDTQKVVFDTAGIILMGCNIHDWMLSFLYVYESAFFAQTNTNGAVIFSDVPAGEYELRTWSPRLKNNRAPVIQKLSISENQTITQTIKVRKKIRRKPRIENNEY